MLYTCSNLLYTLTIRVLDYPVRVPYFIYVEIFHCGKFSTMQSFLLHQLFSPKSFISKKKHPPTCHSPTLPSMTFFFPILRKYFDILHLLHPTNGLASASSYLRDAKSTPNTLPCSHASYDTYPHPQIFQ